MSKSLIKNSLYNAFYKGFTTLFPLITTTYISRVLLPEGVGKVAYAQTVVSYFSTFAALGIPTYGVKAIAQCESNNDREQTFWELLFINALSTTICVLGYYTFVNFSGLYLDRLHLMNVMGILIILNYFNIDWFYRGVEEYGYIATRSVLIKIISFGAMLIFVRDFDDYVIYGFILCIATAGNYLLNVYNARKHIKLKKEIHIQRHIASIFILLLSTIATEVYTMLDTVMLEHFHGDISVGYYSNSTKIVRMIYTLAIAIVATFYPRISNYIKENKKDEYNRLINIGLKIVLIIAIPAVIGVFCTAEYIVPLLYGKAFIAAIPILKLQSVLILIFSVAYLLGHIVLIAIGKEKQILYATITGAIVNSLLNLILIPKFDCIGACVASICAEMMVTFLLIYRAREAYSIQLNATFIGSVIFSSLMIPAVCYMTKIIFHSGTLWMMIVSVTGSVVAYVVTLFALKNEVILYIKKYLRV